MARRTGAGGGSNMYERRSGELLGQCCGECVWAAFDKLVQSEMNLKGKSYVEDGKGYEFDANAEEIRLEIKKVMWERFMHVFKALENTPEYIYEFESLVAEFAEVETVDEK